MLSGLPNFSKWSANQKSDLSIRDICLIFIGLDPIEDEIFFKIGFNLDFSSLLERLTTEDTN